MDLSYSWESRKHRLTSFKHISCWKLLTSPHSFVQTPLMNRPLRRSPATWKKRSRIYEFPLWPWAEVPGHISSLLPHNCKGDRGLLWGRTMKTALPLLSGFSCISHASWHPGRVEENPLVDATLPHVAATRLLGAMTFTLLCASESATKITMRHGDHCFLLSKMLCARWSPYSFQPGLGQGWSKVILGPKEREIDASFSLFLR